MPARPEGHATRPQACLRTLLLLSTMVVAVVGCGPSKPNYQPVRGKVSTSDGEACDGALVVFHPKDAARVNDKKPFGTCAADGTFSLTTDELGDGAEAGEYGVTIVWIRRDEGSAKMSLSSESSGGRDALGGRYGQPESPPFDATVAAGGDNTFDFTVEPGDS